MSRLLLQTIEKRHSVLKNSHDFQVLVTIVTATIQLKIACVLHILIVHIFTAVIVTQNREFISYFLHSLWAARNNSFLKINANCHASAFLWLLLMCKETDFSRHCSSVSFFVYKYLRVNFGKKRLY